MAYSHPHPTPPGVVERPSSPLAADPRHAASLPARQVHIPQTSIFNHLETAARRYPGKTAVQFFGNAYRYAELLRDVERMAGYLQNVCGVERGDRVVVFSQNCPQFIAAYFAILRADAVLVPANAMLLLEEMEHIVRDSGAVAAFVAEELVEQVAPLIGCTSLRHVVVHAYGDVLGEDDAGLNIPDWVRQRSSPRPLVAGGERWAAALAQEHAPAPHRAGPDDLCMLPYTSGTTGKPKACVHTHRTVSTSFVGSSVWRPTNASSVFLAVAPLFHLLGLQTNVNAAIFNGSTIVLMPRWERETAATLIERHGVTFWAALPTMLVDFFSQPGIDQRDLSSLRIITGGGAATPQHISDLLKQRYGLDYIEGYGLTETASFLCTNPLYKPKRGCLGVPTFGVELHLLDPETLEPVAQGEVGEIVAHAGQAMLGYWNNPQANADSFIVIDGKRFLRTGDLASMDEDGYLFMRDRLKRMINASGFKVWPAEVEALLHGHPAVSEACVIAAPDRHRGETVKAVVTLKPGSTLSSEELLAWCREHMATYKAPRLAQIVDSLPKNATGKIAWRELQEQEMARHAS
ncbi:long-chain-fatty-acid--CoA ligase [Pseudomonas denitrificans (nom. rej.)]|uniref:AMP-binding protein n=1 Tax=Pseudomonas denitrificans TaxID=43306 RepID=A0A9X7MZQ2_PSEDE|nr:long-chain-fatty-acid--CoA ligase [Pseudomonas denitrificans (nom. rej.)]QEY72240.1 AMP-binding protein [Pseudomonas denitrificans (nom. rej.)]